MHKIGESNLLRENELLNFFELQYMSMHIFIHEKREQKRKQNRKKKIDYKKNDVMKDMNKIKEKVRPLAAMSPIIAEIIVVSGRNGEKMLEK